jgi:hypothetical protein
MTDFSGGAPTRPPKATQQNAGAFGELLVPPMIGQRTKIFGIGLSRTGTLSLTSALQVLGIETEHYPNDLQTQEELKRGMLRAIGTEPSPGVDRHHSCALLRPARQAVSE